MSTKVMKRTKKSRARTASSPARKRTTRRAHERKLPPQPENRSSDLEPPVLPIPSATFVF
jgi:hypothetical protein